MNMLYVSEGKRRIAGGSRPARYLSASCWLLALVMLGGCDNTVEPFTEDRETSFALSGFLDTATDTQFVRIEPLHPTLFFEDVPEDLGVTVTSLHIETGNTITWQNSRIQLEDGRRTHLYHARFRPVPGGTYLLSVLNAESRGTKARVTVPAEPNFVAAQFDTLRLQQELLLLDVSSPLRSVEMQYQMAVSAGSPVQTVSIDYSDEVKTTVLGGWSIDIRYLRDGLQLLVELNGGNSDTNLRLHGLGLDFEFLSPEWQAENREANIQDGHGFFGAIGRYHVQWVLEPQAVERLGYVDAQIR